VGFKVRKRKMMGMVDLSALPEGVAHAMAAATAHEANILAAHGAYIKGLRFAVKGGKVVSTIEAQTHELELIHLTFNLGSEMTIEE
jgi:hypothetical protein